jgi:DNA-binding transcriptional LysR family regulator
MTEINDYKDLHKGTIRIGIPPMLGAFLFPYIFKEFRSIYPGIELIAVEEGTLAIQKQLDQGNLDIAVIMVNDLLPNLETVPITTSEIYVCLPPDHILKDREKVPFSALRDQPFILLKENTYGRQMILQECMKHDFIPNIVFSSSQIETILGLVEKGAGITFLLESIVRKHSNVISRPLLDPLGVRAGLAWNRDRYISNASRAFIDFIKEFPFQF